MFLRKPKTVICAVCGKPIEPKQSRFVDKNRVTKAERHVHVGCKQTTKPSEPTRPLPLPAVDSYAINSFRYAGGGHRQWQ